MRTSVEVPKSHWQWAFDRAVPHVWQTFLKIREKVLKTTRNPLRFSLLQFSRRGEKGMKTREKDLRSQRRQTEPNPPVFNDFCAYFGKIYGYGFSRDNMQRVPNWDLSSI